MADFNAPDKRLYSHTLDTVAAKREDVICSALDSGELMVFMKTPIPGVYKTADRSRQTSPSQMHCQASAMAG